MAVVGTVLTGISVGKKLLGVFGSGRNAAQLGREQKRQALSKVGFNWLKTSGVPRGQEWNIDNWGDQALDNVGRLYDEYGQIAVDLHNSKRLSDRLASDYNAIRQIAAKKKTASMGSTGLISGGVPDSVKDLNIAGFGLWPILLAVSAVGGFLFYNK